jgi:hypothetical protein
MAEMIDKGKYIADFSFVLILIVILFALFNTRGSMADTWIFVNSLSLLVHMILLNSNVPPNVFYLFRTYLNMLRLSSDDLNERA